MPILTRRGNGSVAELPDFDSPVVREYPTVANLAAAPGDVVLCDVTASFKWHVRADADKLVAHYLDTPFGGSSRLTVRADPLVDAESGTAARGVAGNGTAASGVAGGDVSVADGEPQSDAAQSDTDDGPASELAAGAIVDDGATHEALILGSRPGEWIVLGSGEAVDGVIEEVFRQGEADDSDLVTARDLTHPRGVFRLTGTTSVSTLEKVCSLDWSDPMMPDGAVASASVAKVTCDIARNDVDGAPSYLIFCDRSFGQYLFDALIDAGTEFGISVMAPAPAFG